MIISKDLAARYLLRHHGLMGKPMFDGKDGILKFVRQSGCVQYDPIDVCGRNADLVMQARIPDYKKEWLTELLYKERVLVDYYDKNMSVMSVDDWKYFSYKRRYYKDKHLSKKEIDRAEKIILEYIHANGYVCSKDIDLDEKVSWYWSDTRLSRAALEAMYFRGDLVIHHKNGTQKYYSLAEDVISSVHLIAENPNLTEQAQCTWAVLRRIKSVGMLWNRASDAWLGIDFMNAASRKKAFEQLESEQVITSLEVEGVKDVFYIAVDDLDLLEIIRKIAKDEIDKDEIVKGETDKEESRVEFIAPLDNLMWDRRLIQTIFDFDYKWEIYTPVDQRRFGYYVLPILYDYQFVGRFEAVKDKKTGNLIVQNIWYEKNFKPSVDFKKHFKERLQKFAVFNGCQKQSLQPNSY